jgi:hypothetical protein
MNGERKQHAQQANGTAAVTIVRGRMPRAIAGMNPDVT